MRLSVMLGLFALLLAAGWLERGRFATDALRSELDNPLVAGIADMARFDAVSLPMPAEGGLPERIRLTGASLLDPVTKAPVASADEVEFHVTAGWEDGLGGALLGVNGRGCRVHLFWDENGEDVFVRSIVALVERIIEIVDSVSDPDAPESPFPPLLFEEVEVLCQAKGRPLDRLEGVTVEVTGRDDEVSVDVRLADGVGRLGLLIGRGGIRRVEVTDLPASPTLAHLIPVYGADLARQLSPRGIVDAVTTIMPDGELELEGVLRDAHFSTLHVPFPLGPAEVHFSFRDGRFSIDRAQVGCEGDVVDVTVVGTKDGVTYTVDAEQVTFREAFLGLIPVYEDLNFWMPEDGGSFEVHLTIESDLDLQVSAVQGTGGFHIERLPLSPPGFVPGAAVLEDVVGRFVIDDRWLSLPEVSASYAGGELRGSCTLGLKDDSFDLQAQANDVEFIEFAQSIEREEGKQAEGGGWLQGEINLRGVFGKPKGNQGYGQLSLRGGRLMDTPLIEAIVLAIGFQDRGRNDNHRLDVQFDTQGKVFYLHDLRIELDVFTLTGEGTVRTDGAMDLDLAFIPVPIWLIGDLLELIQKRVILKIEVGGHLKDPEVQAIPLDVVTGPLRALYDFIVSDDEASAEEDDPDSDENASSDG